jgi:glutamate-1-semialdehyde 2,1-aminomutase
VWDADGNEYIEYGSGGRAVTLGHAFPRVCRAAEDALWSGLSYCRPAAIEVEAAERFLSAVPNADMVKFTKDGSTATTAAIKLARAATGKDMVAYCIDHPFFSYDDWFIGGTPMDAGIPPEAKQHSCTFHYNDLASVERVFAEHSGRIAAVILEPLKYDDPQDGFLHKVQALCERNGAVFILDEMITGFRYACGGAQSLFDITPDLSTFGKALANGFALSALCGKRELMELGGLTHDKERVFLLSTTHGAETASLAAGIATIETYQTEPVVETIDARGRQLQSGVSQVVAAAGLEKYIQVEGRPCNLVFVCRDADEKPSQWFRSLYIQEMAKRGVFGPSFVLGYSHSEQDIEHTIRSVEDLLPIYQRALEEGADKYLVGRPSNVVYRRFN